MTRGRCHGKSASVCARGALFGAVIAGRIGQSVLASPPRQLRERLLSRVKDSSRIPGVLFDHGGLLIARSDELAWQAVAPGISYKPLYQDAARQYNTSLVRMEAGAQYPGHHHTAIEELFMLSGDLHMEDQVMRAGDYCRGDSGSLHGETFSDSGCLFLLMVSRENPIVASV
jgi:anti-sigma factor ChrR (cupin superfamily)